MINCLTFDNYKLHHFNMVNPFILDAIGPLLTTLVLFGFCDAINEIRHRHIVVGDCIVPIPGTNYVIKFSDDEIPRLCCTIIDTDGNITYRDIGRITWPGTIIPNPKKIVVVQPCPGIYNTYDLSSVLSDLKGATSNKEEPYEFVKCVVCILKSIGYVSLQNGSPEKEVSPYGIMAQLKVLFDQANIEHATNHMKQIFERMAQLECIVI